MSLVLKGTLCLALLLVEGASVVWAQGDINIADLVLAVRRGLIEAERREATSNTPPMFLVKDFDMTITFIVEKAATGGVSVKVVSLGGNIKQEQTHTVTIHSEMAAFEHVKARLSQCFGGGQDRTYPFCFNRAYQELGLKESGVRLK